MNGSMSSSAPRDLDRAAFSWIAAEREALTDEVVRLCEIPAPTFQEGRRAAWLARRFQDLGHPVEQDEVGNLRVRLDGDEPGPTTLLVAHLDTVFDASVDVRVRREDGRLLAPGVGDDAAGLAALVGLVRLLDALPLRLPGRLLLAATVGEEGLGDLRGMRGLMASLGREVDQVVALDAALEEVVTRAVGSRRYRLRVRGPGGHSWSDYGAPSAVHLLAEAVSRLLHVTVPEEPRSTLNVGTFHGGRAVNAVAAEAELLLDLRSVDGPTLDDLERRVLAVLDAWADEARLSPDVRVDRERVGSRPAAVGDVAELTSRIREAAGLLGLTLSETAASTDAAVPLSLGIPAVAMGVHRGGRAHTSGEWLEVRSLETGLKLLYLVVRALQRPA